MQFSLGLYLIGITYLIYLLAVTHLTIHGTLYLGGCVFCLLNAVEVLNLKAVIISTTIKA